MPFKRSSLRYAHTNGFAHCCYIEDGEKVITTGYDGDIRIWNGVDDDDPNTRCVGEFILYHAYDQKRIYASTDLNTVQCYTYPSGDQDGTEFRFTAPVLCIRVNDKFTAACSEDMTVKVKPKGDTEFFELNEHAGPVLRIDLSVNDLLASASGDGTMKIWDLDTQKVIKTITGLPKITSYQITTKYVTPSFEPKHGKYMAYNHKKQVIILDTTTWETKKTLKEEDEVSIDYTTCCYSPCGKYIAAGGPNGEISVWDIENNRLIKEENKGSDAQSITSIQWNPLNNGEIAYMDNTGQFGLITNIFDDDNNILDRDELIVEVDNDMDFDGIKFNDDDEDEVNENCISLKKLANETMEKNIDDVLNNILESVSAPSVASDTVEHIPPCTMYQMQPPFQSSSTSKSLDHRYMVWNHVGIVRAHKTVNENSIEVEFHDSSVHHGIHLNNYLNHTIASLSTTVLALCCETPGKLVCIVLSGSGGSREWSMGMPDCEEILCVAASEKLVAVATDARYLRLFSSMGTQREVISIPGPVVALSAHADRILVAYHVSAATEDQHIAVMLIQTIGMSVRCRETRVALTPASKLTWIGYTDRGTPVTCDSMGMIRLHSMRSNHWMPLCDTSLHTKGASDHYFITDVSESKQIVRGILCRGSRYPVTVPKPMIVEINMQLPLCDLNAEQTQLEETLIRSENYHVDDAERIVKENAIKLFAIACRSEMEARAKELIEMLASPQLLPLAIKYAGKLGRIHLAEKLGELLPQLQEQEKDIERYDEVQQATDLLLNSPATENLIQAQKDKNASPSVIPRPLSISQLKRNPFKKTPQSGIKAANNPLKHLTDNILGFDSQDQNEEDSQLTTENIFNTENIQPSPVATSKPSFFIWYREKKAELKSQKANLSDDELTKYAMGIFKQLPSGNSENNELNHMITRAPPFFEWYQEKKAQLKDEMPDLVPSDLTKYAMSLYKEEFPEAYNKPIADNSKDDTPQTSDILKKRKALDGQSGVAKLAKFTYNK